MLISTIHANFALVNYFDAISANFLSSGTVRVFDNRFFHNYFCKLLNLIRNIEKIMLAIAVFTDQPDFLMHYLNTQTREIAESAISRSKNC